MAEVKDDRLQQRLTRWFRVVAVPAPGSPAGAALCRVLLAGPGAVAATLLVVLGMALWVPPGPAGIDQITIPLVVLPLVWAGLFFHACLDRSLKRAALVAMALASVNGVAVAWHVATTPVASAQGAAP